jgi:NitT/TauT family transport system substrate-binding protein
MAVALLMTGITAYALPALAQTPDFSLAWSEYPSWSAFGVADVVGIIDGEKGKLGRVERKWNVDIVLRQADYDPCLVMYGAKQVDAVCITNMDVLNPSLTRPSVAILPTSTSFGADACLVSGDITDIKQLKDKQTYGLAKTVSEYTFFRNLEMAGEDPREYRFVNRDPAAAALGFQQKRSGVDAIVVWNPFVLESLNKRSDARVLFDSTSIPGEIIDMVVMSQESLDKPGGEAFACAVIDAFYELNKMLEDEKTRDRTLLALGEKFSNLDLQSMRKVVQQTKFYATPEEAIKLFESKELPETMKQVTRFCLQADITPNEPVVAYGKKNEGNAKANLRFDPSLIEKVQKGE